MSVIVSFPLMVYPLRASLHSLIFQQVSIGSFYTRDGSMHDPCGQSNIYLVLY